jgi:hypothetical protein
MSSSQERGHVHVFMTRQDMKPQSQRLNGPEPCALYTAVVSPGIEFMSYVVQFFLGFL